jgi:serine/threonine protein kinase
MIAFSCVHCGQRMKVTDEGGKKAKCSRCGAVVSIAGARASKRGRTTSQTGSGERPQGDSGGERQPRPTITPPRPIPDPEATRLTGPPRDVAAPDLGTETRTGPGLAIHQESTRAEEEGETDRALTAFLSPAESADEIGRLGPYRVLEVVGAGGMGVVFKAEDPHLRRLVALKAMLPHLATSATARQRFVREAQAAAQIQHDHVVAIYQIGEANGVPFLAMPFLRGESLDRRLRDVGGPLPLEEVLLIGVQTAEGLAAIHELGLIHRDIKPANIWLEALAAPRTPLGRGAGGRVKGKAAEEGKTGGTGQPFRVKILDFGLARAAQGDPRLTQEGSLVGSPAYMAPEQANRQSVDARADLFSLGCVLYVMTTGNLPFEGDDVLSTLLAITTRDPQSPHESNPELPEEVSRLILALLEKKPADRPASARAVIEAIAALPA